MTAQTVIELRQYRMNPGRRDELIDLFEREFIESQEAFGVSLLGQFRDLDAPGHFVWMRGFKDMEARKAALEGFYGGEVWQAHREAANATLADNDDVLLLKPPVASARLDLPPRPPVSADRGASPLITVTVQALDNPPGADSPTASRPRSARPWRRRAPRSWPGSVASPTRPRSPNTCSGPSGPGWATASA